MLARDQGVLKVKLRIIVFPIYYGSDSALRQGAVGKSELLFGKQETFASFSRFKAA